MDFESRLAVAHEELSRKGVWKSNYNPPLVQLIRKLGINMPPPYYQGFFSNFALCLTFFAPAWGLINWFVTWRGLGLPVLEAIYSSLLTGALFALAMAIFYLIRCKQLKLTDWHSLSGGDKT